MTDHEQLTHAVKARSDGILAGATFCLGLYVYTLGTVSPVQAALAGAASVLVLAWHVALWRRVVRARKRLGLDWRGRPVG